MAPKLPQLRSISALAFFNPAKAGWVIDIEYKATEEFEVEFGEQYLVHPNLGNPIDGPATISADPGGDDKFLCHGECPNLDYKSPGSVCGNS
jgi:hypothetical protein